MPVDMAECVALGGRVVEREREREGRKEGRGIFHHAGGMKWVSLNGTIMNGTINICMASPGVAQCVNK